MPPENNAYNKSYSTNNVTRLKIILKKKENMADMNSNGPYQGPIKTTKWWPIFHPRFTFNREEQKTHENVNVKGSPGFPQHSHFPWITTVCTQPRCKPISTFFFSF